MKKYYLLIIFILFVYFGLSFFKSLSKSLIFKNNGRFTYVIYGEKAYVISFNYSDRLHSIIELSHTDEVLVPGGYGLYRIGSLGKLAYLENDFTLIDRAISSYISAPINGSIVYKGDMIYDISNDSLELSSDRFKLLFLWGYTSNISFIDRLYIVIQSIMANNSSNFERISNQQDRFIGRLYDKELRHENKTIQIMYLSYSGAENIARIIGGSGLRVVDMLSQEKNINSKCEIIESTKVLSNSSKYLRDFTGCIIKKGNTQVSDIILILDKNVESLWMP